MVVFTPASDVWTLGYDQFDNICWRHKKTEGIYYVPPGQPLTLPPRGLSNMFRPNVPNNHRVNPNVTGCAGAYSLQGLGGAIHFNNSVLRASETKRVWPVSFVTYTGHHPSPPMSRTVDGKHWIPQRSFENVPSCNPNAPFFTTPATVRAEAPPRQGLGKEVHFNNSVLEVPEAARLQPVSIMEGANPQTLPQMSTKDEENHGLPPRGLANAPLPNLPTEPDLTSTTKEHATLSLPSGDVKKHFDNGSTQEVPEAARLRPAFIIEDSPHPPTHKSTTEDEKHGLPPKSSVNPPPPPNLSSDSHLIPSTNDHDRESLLSGGVEEDHFDINSTVSVVDDTKSHISSPLSEAKLVSTPRSLMNAPEDPPFIPAATESTEASLPRGYGEQGHLNNNSAPEVPEAVRVRIASLEDAKAHTSSVLSAENADSGLPPMILDTPCSNVPEDPYFAPSSTTRTETSLLWEDGKGDLSDGNSSLNVPEAARVWPASIVDTMPHPSDPISKTEEVDLWSLERDIRGKEYYVNIITGESQYKKPDCLKKYARRR